VPEDAKGGAQVHQQFISAAQVARCLQVRTGCFKLFKSTTVIMKTEVNSPLMPESRPAVPCRAAQEIGLIACSHD
jgi:hypothetical protein